VHCPRGAPKFLSCYAQPGCAVNLWQLCCVHCIAWQNINVLFITVFGSCGTTIAIAPDSDTVALCQYVERC
jgi:hypothetical protein